MSFGRAGIWTWIKVCGTGQIKTLTWRWCKIWSQGITKVITVHPERDMEVCTKCQRNPSKSCWDISVKTTTWQHAYKLITSLSTSTPRSSTASSLSVHITHSGLLSTADATCGHSHQQVLHVAMGQRAVKEWRTQSILWHNTDPVHSSELFTLNTVTLSSQTSQCCRKRKTGRTERGWEGRL